MFPLKFTKDIDVLKEKINQLSLIGYNSFRGPGGTSFDSTYAVIVMILFYDKESKSFYFVASPYNLKAGGNRQNKIKEEKEKETAIREVFEETGLIINPDNLHFLYEMEVPDTRHSFVGQKHKKYFYCANEWSDNCNLLDFNVNDLKISSRETAAPIIMPPKMFLDIAFSNHKKAAIEAILFTLNDKDGRASEDKDYGNALISLCKDTKEGLLSIVDQIDKEAFEKKSYYKKVSEELKNFM